MRSFIDRAPTWVAFAAVAALAACGGSGGSGSGTIPGTGPSSAPPPTATPTPPVASGATDVTFAGASFGTPNQFTPPASDTPTGGNGQTVDGIPCDPQMQSNYHVHPLLALYVNGSQVAIPYGLGMQSPGAPVNGFVNTATCFYYLHTHDSSGILHVEDPSATPISQSLYTLKSFLDIWGITAGPNNFGPFTGSVEVFTSGSMMQSALTVNASQLSYFGNDPNLVPLYSHEYIVVEVGPTYPSSLPNVQFYEQH